MSHRTFLYSARMPARQHPALCCEFLASQARRYMRLAESPTMLPNTREIVMARAALALLHLDRFSQYVLTAAGKAIVDTARATIVPPPPDPLGWDVASEGEREFDTIPAPAPDFSL